MLQSNLSNSLKLNHTQYEWKTDDGKILFAQKWDAGENTRAAILLVHGLGEHSSRYAPWAGKLNNEGIAVLSFDFRGHGQTPGKPGKVTDYTKLLDDVGLLITKGKNEFPDIPLFLYGHSMGGNLVANYAINNNLNLAGIILTSPWFEITNKPPRIVLTSVLFFSKLLPWVVANSKLKPEHLSRELREVHLYKNDNLVHDRISLGLFGQAYEKGIRAKRSIYKINAPLLVMHGSEDQITSCQASRDFIRNASAKTTYIEWEGCSHELHNDIDRDNVFFRLVEWVNNQMNFPNG